MKRIFIATDNPHKLKKIKGMLNEKAVIIESPDSADLHIDVDENAETFEGNAVLKAVAYSKQYDGLVIASDGGMSIPSLEGWEATRTKRFAGEGATDLDRLRLILKQMEGKEGEERYMVWREAIAIAKNGQKLFSIEVYGSEGMMAKDFDKTRYRPGIWLCSLWIFPQFEDKNFFDLSPIEMNEAEISWARLGQALQKYLAENKYFTYISGNPREAAPNGTA